MKPGDQGVREHPLDGCHVSNTVIVREKVPTLFVREMGRNRDDASCGPRRKACTGSLIPFLTKWSAIRSPPPHRLRAHGVRHGRSCRGRWGWRRPARVAPSDFGAAANPVASCSCSIPLTVEVWNYSAPCGPQGISWKKKSIGHGKTNTVRHVSVSHRVLTYTPGHQASSVMHKQPVSFARD
jgi:hypothetical protein